MASSFDQFSVALPETSTASVIPEGDIKSEASFSEMDDLKARGDYLNFLIKNLVVEFHERLDDFDQSIRRNSVRIFNVKEEPFEDPFIVVLEILKNKMNIPILMSDILACYRLGQEKMKPRPLIARFHCLWVQKSVLQNKWLLKGTQIGICQDLAPQKAKLFADVKERFGGLNVWVENGDVKVILPSGNKLCFRSIRQLNNYMGIPPDL